MVFVTRFGVVLVGKVAKFKSSFEELIPVYFCFSFRVEFSQNSAILTQDIIDVSHKICGIAIELVIIATSTLGRTKFLIGSALEFVSTFQAFTSHKESVELSINVC